MTDHIGRAALFHKEYLRLRTPGRVPQLADVLALANYHATMAVVDAVRGLALKPVEFKSGVTFPPGFASELAVAAMASRGKRPQDATGDDLRASQAEPGQVDGGEATEAGEFSDCPRCDRHLRAVQHFKSRAEKAESERDAILDELRAFIPTMPVGVIASLDYPRNEIQAIIDRHTPEG